MKKYICITDRKHVDGNMIDYNVDDVFYLIDKISAEDTLNKKDSVKIQKENEKVCFIITEKKFKKEFKTYGSK